MTTPWMTGTPRGASRLSTFQVCQKKFEWSYVKNLVPIKSSPSARFGSAIHEGLRVYYNSPMDQPFEERCLAAITQAVKYVEQFEMEPTERELVINEVVAAMDQYFQKYNPETLIPIMVEKPFSLNIRGYEFTGRLDMIGKWLLNDKEYLVVPDHKTTSMDWERFFKQWTFDLAIRGYIYAARKLLGEEVHGMINAIRRRKTKAFEVEFDRQPIFVKGEDLEVFEQEVEGIYLDIKDREEGRRIYAKNGKACVGMFECEYRRLCMFPSEAMETTMYKQREEVKAVAEGE